jgi:hypothetical protein
MQSAPTALPDRDFARPMGQIEGLTSLWRAFVGGMGFPVRFRSTFEAVPFWIATALLIFYAVAPAVGPLAFYLKYLFTASILICCLFLIAARQRLCLWPAFLLGPCLLSMIGAVSFASTFAAAGGNTYSSALIPLIVVAVPMFVPALDSKVDAARIVIFLVCVFATAATLHVFWQLVGSGLALSESNRTGSVSAFGPRYAVSANVIVYLALVAGIFHRTSLLGLALFLAVVSLLIRPSSTLGFTIVFAVTAIAAHRIGLRWVFRIVNCLAIGGILVANLAILGSRDIAEAVYSIEPYMKSDVLHSSTNNDFRLAIITAARDEVSRNSLLIGQGFEGNIDVPISRYLPWYEAPEAPIHSDFLTIIVQGGLVGLALFSTLFVGLAQTCLIAARRFHAAEDEEGELLFDAILAIEVVFMLDISFNPMMQILECVLPFLMVVMLGVFLARGAPRPSKPRPAASILG